MAQTLGTLLVDIKGDTTQLIQGFNRAEKAVTKTTQTMGSAVKVLTGVFASLQAIDLAKGYAKQVDELQNVNNRLKLATKTAQEFNTAQKELFTQAQNTRTMYVGTIDLYGRIAKSTQNLNMSQKELLSLTNSINKAMIIGGGSTESQQAALIQFGQAFSSNFKAVGQELGSIREQAPRLYEALIKGTAETNTQFKKLVDNGEEASGVFKKWAEDGLLSSEIIVKALKNQGIVLDSEFGKMVMTIEQSMVTARNSIQKLIYDFDQTSGVSKTVSENIKSLSSSIDSLSPEKVEKLAENFKEGAIAVATAYGSIKLATTAMNAYSFASEKVIGWNKASIEIENAKTKAISLGEQATKARKLADEALNVSRQSGLVVAQNNYQMLNKEASKLEEAAKKQQALSYQIEATGKSFSIAAIASNAYKSALASIPFIAISVAIGAVATALLSASRASQTLEGTLKSTGEELKKLTNNQLQYRKELLEQELIQTRLDMANAKARAAKSSATAEDKAERDEAVKNFEEQTQKLREIKQIQDELAKPTKGTNSTSGTTSGDGKNKKTPLNDELQGIIDKSVLIKRKYDELMEQLKSSGNATAENIKKLNDAQAEEIKSLSKDEIKEAKKSADEQKKILEDKQSQYYNYYEKIKDYDKLWFLEERKLREDNKYLKEDELNRLLEVEKQAFDKRNETQKEYLSADEWRDYYLKIKEYDNAWLIEQSELYSKYGDSLGENFAHFLEIAKTEFYDKINEENSKLSDEFFKFKLEFDTNGLNDLGKSLYTIRDATEELGKEQKLYNDAIWEARQHGKDTAKIEEQHTQNQLIGYSNIAGAMSTMYEEGSRQAAAFQAVQTTLALIEATRAIVSQGTGDPYTAIPRMIAMAAMVTSLLGNIGIAFGMNKTTSTSDAYASMSVNEGKGTVISDTTKASESITKSLDVLKDFAEPQYQTLLSMNKYLAVMASNFNGISNMIVRSSGFATGQGFVPYDSGYKNNISATQQSIGGIAMNAGLGAMFPASAVGTLMAAGGGGAVASGVSALLGAGASKALVGALAGTGIGLVTALLDKFVLGGAISNLVGKVIGGIFGKTSVSMSLADAGMIFADQLLVDAKEDFQASAYQVITKTTSKKSWFSKSSSSQNMTFFSDLYKGITDQFSNILKGMYYTVFEASKALDMTGNEIFQKLDTFIVSIGKVSLKGQSGEEVSKTLSAVFSKVGDELAEYAILGINEFQQAGEGLFETLIRVAKGMEEAELYISKLGNTFLDVTYFEIQNKQGNVGFEALLKSIQRVEEATYPVNNNLLEIVNNLEMTAEELYQVYTGLDDLRNRLIYLGQAAQGLSSSMIFGAGNVGDLQKGFLSFFEKFLSESEQLTYETNLLLKEFDKIGISIPTSKDAFKQLLSSLDLTTESGQQLYGRLISLSAAFADISEKTVKTIEELEKQLQDISTNGIKDFTTGLETIFNTLKGLREIATSFIDSFSASSLGDTREQIRQYNKLRNEFNSFFDATGNLNANVTEQQAKDLYSKLSGLGTAIGKSQQDLQQELVGQFERDLFNLDLSDQVLKVNVVDGLADLLGLSEDQKKELQKVASDGNITKQELNNIGRLSGSQLQELLNVSTRLNNGIKTTDEQIKGLSSLNEEQKRQLIIANQDGLITNQELNNIGSLTETQKQGILDFASNSSFFSTESTLSNLAEYSRLQLEAIKRTQAEETVNLSKETLTVGNYIGAQEKIDLANTLGMSFETAKPLIEKLQGLSGVNQKVAISELKNMIGFNGTSYDKNQLAIIERLNPYLSENIINSISSIKNEGTLNRNNAIANFTARINELAPTLGPTENAIRNKYQPAIDSYNNEIAWLELLKYGQSAETQVYLGINQNSLRAKLANEQYAMNSELASVLGNIKTSIFNYQQQIAQMQTYSMQGYAVGATNIPYDQIAQIHQGEMIIPKTFSEGLRTGELSLSANTPNSNAGSLNLFEGVKEIMNDVFKTFADYPKKTHDLLDDVINGRAEMRVKTI